VTNRKRTTSDEVDRYFRKRSFKANMWASRADVEKIKGDDFKYALRSKGGGQLPANYEEASAGGLFIYP
jgi:hypothetical protein